MLYLLHQAVTKAAERSPESDAIRCRDASLSYANLERKSNQLARVLRDRGVVRGDRIGIYAAKCVELATAIYGIQKAGAAYVPLDVTAPPARLRKIIQDCELRILVTHPPKRRSLAGLLSGSLPVDCCIGIDPGEDLARDCVSWDTVAQASTEAPPVNATEQDLAYVLYTSGSTGEPKGIMHTHRSALAFAEVAVKTYGFDREDRISNHAPLHFDLSTLDFFSTAVCGGTTIVIPEEYTIVPASLSQLMEKERLTVLYCVPLALIQLLLHGALEHRDLSRLRWILFGGEPFPVKHLRALMERLPHVRFSNVYGPTEVNGCTYHPVPPIPEDSDEPIPIGGLFENADALVVDEQDRMLPPGMPGELLIRSATRMAGYWRRPDLTEAATFQRTAPGGNEELFHRTGDLVELQPDGTFKFLGRKDRQIKTRGHRVELDEIEAALLTHGAIEESAAFAVPDGQGSQRIEAAVLLTDGASVRPADVEKHLRSLLPPYAIPVRLQVLSSFPRTATGKIDRLALRERATAEPSSMNGAS